MVLTIIDPNLERFLQPIVSTANIGQLAVDLLIASFSLQRIAVFDPTYFVPVVGAREDGLEGITTALEREPLCYYHVLCTWTYGV